MTDVSLDTRWLREALAEGRRGRPSPEPQTGVIVTAGDARLGSSHRAQAGEDPFSPALLEAAERARGATLYCSVEPTSSEAERLVAAKVGRVVFAAGRPGGAAGELREAGIEVSQQLKGEGEAVLRGWRRFSETGLPFVTLKAAVTLDGRTATRTGDSKWITGEAARAEVHRMRAHADAILVGVGTVLADDPALTVRHVEGPDPIRVVLDTHLRTPVGCKLTSGDPPTWVLHGREASEERRAALSPCVELIEVPTQEGGVVLETALRVLAKRGVVTLMVEGGGTVHGAFLRERLAQRAAVFIAPVILGDDEAMPLAAVGPQPSMAAAFRLSEPHARTLGPDVLVEGDLL